MIYIAIISTLILLVLTELIKIKNLKNEARLMEMKRNTNTKIKQKNESN